MTLPFSVMIDQRNGLGLGVFNGTFDVEVSKQALVELWGRAEWNGRAVVWDMRQARLDVSPQDVQVFAQFILGNQPAIPPSRVAFVVGEDLDYGTMRMFEVYREDPRTETRVFWDYEEAVAWAEQGQPRSLSE